MDFREKNEKVLCPNGRQFQTKEVCLVLIEVFNKKRQKVRLQLEDVLLVPQFKCNLISIDKALEKEHSKMFKDKKESVRLANFTTYFPLTRKHRSFSLRTQFRIDQRVCNLFKVDNSQLWNERLGHFNFTDVKDTIPRNLLCAKDFREISDLCQSEKVSVPE